MPWQELVGTFVLMFASGVVLQVVEARATWPIATDPVVDMTVFLWVTIGPLMIFRPEDLGALILVVAASFAGILASGPVFRAIITR